MRTIILLIVCIGLLGCANKRFPADVTGELEPINKQQVIDYEI